MGALIAARAPHLPVLRLLVVTAGGGNSWPRSSDRLRSATATRPGSGHGRPTLGPAIACVLIHPYGAAKTAYPFVEVISGVCQTSMSLPSLLCAKGLRGPSCLCKHVIVEAILSMWVDRGPMSLSGRRTW